MKNMTLTVVPDRGWAWVTLAASFYFMFLYGGMYKCYGFLFVEFLDLYEAGPEDIAWVSATFAIFGILLSPMSGYLGDRYSIRRVVIVLTPVATSGILVAAYAPVWQVTLVGYGVLFGIPIALLNAMMISCPSRYFSERRALANGIAFSGGSVGTLVLPSIYTSLIETYGIRGTLLVISGFVLNLAVAGAVLRPLQASQHQKELTEKNTPNGDPEEQIKTTDVEFEPGLNELNKHLEIPQHQNWNTYDPMKQFDQEDLLINGPTQNEIKKHKITNAKENSQLFSDTSVHFDMVKPSNTIGRIFTLLQELISNLKFTQLLFLLFCSMFGLYNSLAFIPPYAEKDLNLSKADASVFLTVTGACDLLSRLLFGYIGDWKATYRKQITVAAQTLTGVVGIITTFFPSYASVMTYMVTLGLFGSVFLVYAGPFMVDTIGVNNVGISYGLFCMLIGVATFIGPPLFGYIKVTTGSFVGGIRLGAACFLCGALVFAADIDKCKTLYSKIRPHNKRNQTTRL